MLDFHFKFSWDWPDEEMGDVALIYKELEVQDLLYSLLEHTFRVENDLMLSPTDFEVEDISGALYGSRGRRQPCPQGRPFMSTGRAVVYEEHLHLETLVVFSSRSLTVRNSRPTAP